jgi:stringent starvation protein B
MEDSGFTPHILVDCNYVEVLVPKQFVKDGKIVLNIANNATDGLILGNEQVEFKARFEGKSISIKIPTQSILSIYAVENGEGMFFGKIEGSQKKDSDPGLKILD